MEMAQGQIGPEAKYDVKFEGGKMSAAIAYDGEMGGASVEVHIPAEKIVDALIDVVEKAIPGDQTQLAAMLKGVVSGALK
jgi:hypothetical protein